MSGGINQLEALLETPGGSWSKRFLQKHYSYRDGLIVAATPPVANLGSYVFGTNARAISPFNWPMANDWIDARNTYAREVFIYCRQATFVQFVSLNPRYRILINQLKTPAQIAALIPPVPQYITEVSQKIPAEGAITYFPTYAVSMNYWFDTVAGEMDVGIEGNSEGVE